MPVIIDPFPTTPSDPATAVDGLTLVTPPTAPLVTYAMMKSQLRLDDDVQQAYVEALVEAATDYVERATASSLMPRTYLAVFRAGERIVLERGPILSIESITDGDGASITTYSTRNAGVRLEVVPTGAGKWPLSVTYVAGYADASRVPAMIKLAIQQIAATSFDNRESVSERGKIVIPHAAADFLRLQSRALGVA